MSIITPHHPRIITEFFQFGRVNLLKLIMVSRILADLNINFKEFSDFRNFGCHFDMQTPMTLALKESK